MTPVKHTISAGTAHGYTATLALGVSRCLPGCCSWIMSLGAKTRPWALTSALTGGQGGARASTSSF